MRLVGVGMGPGDPDLVTVKAVRVLRDADLVVVAVTGPHEQGRAEAALRAHVEHDRIVRLVVEDDGGAGAPACEEAADAVARQLNDYGGTVAFATLGDPNIHSIFSCLAEEVCARVPEADIETVPGITAMQDLASRSGTVLCDGTELLVLLPLTDGMQACERALALDGTVVVDTDGRHLPDLLDVLRRHDRLDDAVCGTALGQPDERIDEAAELTRPSPSRSTVLVPARRTGRAETPA